MVLGNLLSTGRLTVPFLSHGDALGTRAADVGLGFLPVIVILLIGVVLL